MLYKESISLVQYSTDLGFPTVDVVLLKPKWKIAKNPYRCSKILLQWKFQIDLANLTLKQTISKNDNTIRFWNF